MLFYDLARQEYFEKTWFDSECMLLRIIEQLEQNQQTGSGDVVEACFLRSHGLFPV